MSYDGTTECELHELLNCVICKEKAKPKQSNTTHPAGTLGFKRGAVNPNAIKAQFDSTCPRCEEEIIEGDDIVYSEVHQAFVHEGNC